ncbi:MAG: CopM family metallochaperone, partial [Rhizobiaceae bacterium]
MGSGEMDHAAMGHDTSSSAAPKGDQGEASKAFAKANATMHTGMDIEFSGNTDVDFAKGMIPHHQGAVDMAKIVLQYGKDADLRKLAEGVVSTQESE